MRLSSLKLGVCMGQNLGLGFGDVCNVEPAWSKLRCNYEGPDIGSGLPCDFHLQQELGLSSMGRVVLRQHGFQVPCGYSILGSKTNLNPKAPKP